MYHNIKFEYLRVELCLRGMDDIKDSHTLLKELNILLIIVITYGNINVHNLKKERKKEKMASTSSFYKYKNLSNS